MDSTVIFVQANRGSTYCQCCGLSSPASTPSPQPSSTSGRRDTHRLGGSIFHYFTICHTLHSISETTSSTEPTLMMDLVRVKDPNTQSALSIVPMKHGPNGISSGYNCGHGSRLSHISSITPCRLLPRWIYPTLPDDNRARDVKDTGNRTLASLLP